MYDSKINKFKRLLLANVIVVFSSSIGIVQQHYRKQHYYHGCTVSFTYLKQFSHFLLATSHSLRRCSFSIRCRFHCLYIICVCGYLHITPLSVCVCFRGEFRTGRTGNKQLSKEIIGRLFDGLKPNRRKKHLCHICTKSLCVSLVCQKLLHLYTNGHVKWTESALHVYLCVWVWLAGLPACLFVCSIAFSPFYFCFRTDCH